MSRPSADGAGAPLPPQAVALMLVLCMAWGLNFVAAKIGAQGIPPVLQSGLRSVLAGLLLWAWCRAMSPEALARWRDPALLRPGLMAGLLFGLEFACIYLGVTMTTAARAVVFVYAGPFVVALGAHWLVPGDRLTLPRLVGLVLAFAGLVLAFADGFAEGFGWRAIAGDALCLAGGVLWGATTLLVKVSPLRGAAPALVLQYQLVVSAALLLALAPLLDPAPLAFAPTPVVVAAFLYQAAGIAFASYLAWFWLIGRHSASRLAAFSVLSPLFGVAAGAVLLDEPLGAALILAAALVTLGVWLVNRAAPAAAPLPAGARG